MSRAALLEPPAPADGPGAESPPHGEQPTLGEVIAGAWEGLLTVGRAPCPVCGGAMELREGAGRCAACEARLE